MNGIVERKHIYTAQLVNILTPLIYEGMKSLYDDAINLSEYGKDILLIFQGLLIKVPKCNTNLI